MDRLSADPSYLVGLRTELVGKKGADRQAVLDEIKRVGGTVPDQSPPPRRSV